MLSAAQLGCSMLWVITSSLCTLRQGHAFKDVLVRFPLLVSSRNMSSSQAKRPVTLLGTMAFGGRADAELSLEMVKAFLGRGHNHLDTAFMYVNGKSEEVIGGMNLPKTGTLLEAHIFLVNREFISVC